MIFFDCFLPQLILRVGQAQESLRRLEVFRDVATIIDVDKTSTDTNTAKSGDEDTYNVIIQNYFLMCRH